MEDRVPPFRAPYAPADEHIAAQFLRSAPLRPEAEARIDARAGALVAAIRARAGGVGGIEDFLHEFSLSTKEGLALMVLAESLLRVPDSATADRLIEDKLSAGDFAGHEVRSPALLVSASAWALGISARVISSHETPETILHGLVSRLGRPAVRTATRQAMRLMGSHFVLGQTIGEALARGGAHPEFRYSFDMLGEGARTAADAERYFEAYAEAIAAIGAAAGASGLPQRPGISVKLSALHPRYEAVSRVRVVAELTPRVIELARAAKSHQLNLTIDAEEADRLELSLDIVGRTLADPGLAGWDGFGLAVQAYQKRAPAVIDWVAGAAQALGRRVMVRLVKGAYWDTEVKRAQERGLADYPVFSRKAMTDLCYMACARKLLAARPRLYPQIATHNALTVASVIEAAGGVEGYEFQRLYGMGEALYEALLRDAPGAACRVYAPVGGHRDLLAYLVRRLLENGANSSFVYAAADPKVPVSAILERPAATIGSPDRARHPRIPRPPDLYLPGRRNSSGVEFGDAASLEALLAEVRAGQRVDGHSLAHALPHAMPLVDGVAIPGHARPVRSPIDGAAIGVVTEGDDATVASAIAAASAGFAAWDATAVEARAEALVRAAGALEQSRGRLIALLQAEGGKTLDDALAEVREAVDYCRYYAQQARLTLTPETMPGPTGEADTLCHRGRGVFVCISPWNFPLAIFTGQVMAALAAGNAVVAKPAEQTPLVAAEAVRPVPPRRHSRDRAASRPRRRGGRRRPGRPSGRGRRRLHRLDRGRPDHQPGARRQGRADRPADRGDRRDQRHDRRCHRPAGAGDRRRDRLGVPLGGAALLGVAPAVPAGRRRRRHHRHGGRRGAATRGRRSPRHRHPCRAGDRCRGQGQARQMGRRHGSAGPPAVPLGATRRRPRAPTWRRRSSRSTAPATSRRRCSAPCFMWCDTAPTRSIACSTTSPRAATASPWGCSRASTRRCGRWWRGCPPAMSMSTAT